MRRTILAASLVFTAASLSAQNFITFRDRTSAVLVNPKLTPRDFGR